MADSTSNVPQISSGQSAKEVVLNRLTDGTSSALLWAYKDESTTGLTWAYRGGRYKGSTIADGTVTLTTNTTNYVVAARSNGAVSTSTSNTNWNDTTTYWRTYLVVTSAGATVSSFQDHRDIWGQIAAASAPTIAREWQVAASDETTALTTGTAKLTARAPRAMTVTGVRASLTTAQASGSIFTVDINEAGTTVLSTKLTIDNTEKTSTTAATAAVVSDSAIADDAEITIDIDQVGDGTATGLKVTILYT